MHTGFQNAQASTAAEILAAVKTGTAQYNTNKGQSFPTLLRCPSPPSSPANIIHYLLAVITVGHSLGGAIAELDAIYLKLQIPSLSVSARLFGLPQVGNAAFASFAGRVVPDSTHVNNKQGSFLPPPHPTTFLLSPEIPRSSSMWSDLSFALLLLVSVGRPDPVPALPGRALGFTQIAGEIYITPGGVYQSCSGIDNAACAAGKSGSNLNDHGG